MSNSSSSTSSGSVLIVGLSTGPIWGVPDLAWAAGQSMDIDHNGDSKEMANGAGQTVAVAYFNNKDTVSYTVKIKGTIPTMYRGMQLSVVSPETKTSVTYLLDDYKFAGKNDDFSEYSLNLVKRGSVDMTKTMTVSGITAADSSSSGSGSGSN